MTDLNYLRFAEVLELHAAVMRMTGYVPAPLRDEGLLNSALLRPQMAAHYEDANLIRQAALLAIGISQAQAFLDGNKRTAFAACDTFLRLNGLRIPGPGLDFARQLEAVAERDDTLEAATDRFELWLRDHVEPR